MEGVRYVVSMQYTEDSFKLLVPEMLTERDDVEVVFLKGRGLSRNRNNAIDAAYADILLIADDDEKLSADALLQLRQIYEEDDTIDIALIQICTLQGEPLKTYPQGRTSFESALKQGYYPSSLEISLRRDKLSDSLRFNTNYGLGSELLSAGEEDVFLCDALRRGLNAVCVPIMIGATEQATTGSRFLTDEKVQMSKGAVFAYCYSQPDALWRITKESAHHFLYNHRNPFPLWLNMYRGVRLGQKYKRNR